MRFKSRIADQAAQLSWASDEKLAVLELTEEQVFTLMNDSFGKIGFAEDDGAVYCQDCEMWLNGPVQWEDHKWGKKHKKNLRGKHKWKIKVPTWTEILLEQRALMADIACCVAVRRFLYGRIASRL